MKPFLSFLDGCNGLVSCISCTMSIVLCKLYLLDYVIWLYRVAQTKDTIFLILFFVPILLFLDGRNTDAFYFRSCFVIFH